MNSFGKIVVCVCVYSQKKVFTAPRLNHDVAVKVRWYKQQVANVGKRRGVFTVKIKKYLPVGEVDSNEEVEGGGKHTHTRQFV